MKSGKELKFTDAKGALEALLRSGRTLGTLRQRRLPVSLMLREWFVQVDSICKMIAWLQTSFRVYCGVSVL